jgi:hypothetical protein
VDQADTEFMIDEQPRSARIFDEAINHPEEDVILKWIEAIHKEFNKMNFRGIWKKLNKVEMPIGHRCV